MQWVRSAVQRERARQGGASREVTLPSQTTFSTTNTQFVLQVQTQMQMKQPQIHKHLKNTRGQTNPFFKGINTEKQDSKNNNKNTQMTSATLLHKVETSWEVFFLQGCVSQELFFTHQNFFLELDDVNKLQDPTS